MIISTSPNHHRTASPTNVVEITTGNTVHHITIPARPRAAKSPPLRSAVENLMKGGICSTVQQLAPEEVVSRGLSRGSGAKSSLGDNGRSSTRKKRSRSTILNMKKELDEILAPLAPPENSSAVSPRSGRGLRSISPLATVINVDEADATVMGGRTRLMLAAIVNDASAVGKYITEQGQRTPEGKTALMFAAEHGSIACINQLIGWESGLVSNSGWTAIMYAIAAQKLEAVEFLAKRQNELTSTTKDGRTPLILAAELGNEEIVQLFLESRLIGMTTVDGRTALMQAAWNRHLDCVRWLAKKESGMQDAEGKTALMLAIEGKCTDKQEKGKPRTEDFVALLASEIGKTMPDGTTALMCAVLNKEEDSIPLLKSELRKKQKNGRTALILATKQGTLATLHNLLSEAGIRDNSGKPALYYALEGRNMTHIRELPAEYNMIIEDNMSMLMSAIMLGNEEAALIILRDLQKQALDSKNKDSPAPLYVPVTEKEQKTALILAVEAGSLALVKELAHIESSYQDTKGNTALMYAAEREFCDAIKILLPLEEHIKNNAGHTALIQMAMNNSILAVSFLLSEACDTDNSGMTALMHAAHLGHHNIVSILVSTKEVGMVDVHEMTALMHAAMNGHVRCVSLLAAKEHHYARMYHLLKAHDSNMTTEQIWSSQSFYSGRTALIIAAMYNSLDCVKHLIPWEAWVLNEHNRLPSTVINIGTYSNDIQDALTIRSIHRLMKTYYAKRRDELGSCNICLNKISTMKCYPCNHTVCCEECAERLVTTKKPCPLCRRSILFWVTECYDLTTMSFTLVPNPEWIDFPSDDEDDDGAEQHSRDDDTDDEVHISIHLDHELEISPYSWLHQTSLSPKLT